MICEDRGVEWVSPDYKCSDLSLILIDRLGISVSLSQLCSEKWFSKRWGGFEAVLDPRSQHFGKRSQRIVFSIQGWQRHSWSKSSDRFLTGLSRVSQCYIQRNKTSNLRSVVMTKARKRCNRKTVLQSTGKQFQSFSKFDHLYWSWFPIREWGG